MSAQIEKWLQSALDYGINEHDFWLMTIGEFKRLINSKVRIIEVQDKKQATFDYILADLIGRSVARLYGSSNKMPTMSEAYPSLFTKEVEEEAIQARRDEVSAIRFKSFANSFNKNFSEGVKQSE